MGFQAKDLYKWVNTDSHKLATVVLAVVGTLNVALYVGVLAGATWTGALLGGIIFLALTVFKMLSVMSLVASFYKRAWNMMKSILLAFTTTIVVVIVLSAVTAGLVRLYDLLPLIVEIVFLLLSANFYRVHSAKILP
ncbi:hypothetical protein H9P43_003964 [Blastocladiella emersonii ATCC 22665]|nr:hypothetical protein H9P43_003964 [Blastocladiella emersonii ATCC 22665]